MSIFSTASSTFFNDANAVLKGLTCEAAVQVGDAVRIEGGIVKQALADAIAHSNVLGLVESKETLTICSVRVSGVTADNYTGLDESLDYYLSATTPGALTTTAPSSPGQILLRLGQPYDAQRLVFVRGTRVIRA